MDAVPLDKAMLCMDCNCITDSLEQCGVCGSQSLMPVQRALDKTSIYTEVRGLQKETVH